MPKPTIDLSEFLSPDERKRLSRETNIRVLPSRHIWCHQCGGSGERRARETYTRPLTPKQEDKLLELGKNPPIQQILSDELVKCERCSGNGHHHVPDQERNRNLVYFWAHFICECGRRYDSPAYANSFLVKTDFYTPIIREGRVYGWRYNRTIHQPVEDIAYYKRLPYRIEHVHQRIPACVHCVREQLIICLPHIQEE